MIGKTIGFGILGAVGGFTIAMGVMLINDKIGRDRYYETYPDRINTSPEKGGTWDTISEKPLKAHVTQQIVGYLTIGGAVVSAIVGGGIGSAVVRVVKEQSSRLLN